MENITLLKTLHGSRLYNIHNENSDYDYKTIFLEPKDVIYGLNSSKTIKTKKDESNIENEIIPFKHFCKLLAQNNIWTFECIFSDLIIDLNDAFKELFINNRYSFLNKQLIINLLKQSYSIRNDSLNKPREFSRSKIGYDMKTISHCFRLLIYARQIAQHCEFNPDLTYSPYREQLLQMKYDENFFSSINDIKDLFSSIEKETIEILKNSCTLKDNIDISFINSLMIQTYERIYI